MDFIERAPMSFEEEFQAAERKALVENTAQDVFNNLKDLVNHASLHASRWIWELLQNARDAAIPGSPLHVNVCLTEDEVSFQHDGMAFNTDQVAHLIHHGSTKYQEEGQVGRFGTGFLSTHIISKVPRVSGRLTDGRDFSFVLDRTGASPRELTDSMDRSSKEFVASVGKSSDAHVAHSTRYDYPVSTDVEEIAKQGVGSLESYAPYVLAFNPEIESIEIVRNATRRLYQRRPSKPLLDSAADTGIVEATPVEVQSSGPKIQPFVVATATSESFTVGVVAQETGDGLALLYGPHVPRFFMAFPLFGTEGMGFPGVINSLSFRPQKDRDGLYLGPEHTEDNTTNKRLIEAACPLFVTLLKECAAAKWRGVHLLCKLMLQIPRGVDEVWLHSIIKSALVEPIRSTPLLLSCGGDLISANNSWIPLGSSTVPGSTLWELLRERNVSNEMLVEESTAPYWEENLRGWAAVLSVPPEQLDECYTLKNCANKLAECGSVGKLHESLSPDSDPVSWCNKLFGLLIVEGQSSLFDNLSLLPDQNGILQKRNYLRLDREIDYELKDIAELLGLSVRGGLLHKGIQSPDIHRLIQAKTQDDVLAEVVEHLKEETENDDAGPDFRQGNIRLFAWMLKNNAFAYLESFPALTQELVGDGTQPTISLTKNGKPESLPLAPPKCWPEGTREFSDLFPLRHVLSSDYYAACGQQELWTAVAEKGFVRVSPIFETTDYVQDFLPDDTLTDDDTHKSKQPIKTTHIAFLREKNVGLMDTARKSKAKCLLLLRFLASHMIPADTSWKEQLNVGCECDNHHRCWRAGWVVPLKKNKWIYLDKNRSEHLTADSLARLLREEREIIGLLAYGEGTSFLAAIGVSAGDFLMRSVSSDEDTRVTLSKSFIQMFQAVGGDIQEMSDLAHELAAHPETIKAIREQGEIRKKIKKNQDVGKAVEEALQSALGNGYGLKLERTGTGSDYSVEQDSDFLDESGNEILLGISTPTGKFLIEIKSTVGRHVRMTEVQGKTAKAQPNNYLLCVVHLPDQNQQIDSIMIREKVKFVTDIGTKIAPIVEAVESLEGTRAGVLSQTGPIEVEMQDQATKFKIGEQVWQCGIGFDEAVRYFGGRLGYAEFSPVENTSS